MYAGAERLGAVEEEAGRVVVEWVVAVFGHKVGRVLDAAQLAFALVARANARRVGKVGIVRVVNVDVGVLKKNFIFIINILKSEQTNKCCGGFHRGSLRRMRIEYMSL